MLRIHVFRLLLPAFILLLAGSVPATADWLLTQDGSRFETQGPWQVRGSSVVFTTPRGALQSIRLTDVDLEASERATFEPAEPVAPTPPAETPREPVLVLTNKDIPRAVLPLPEADEALEIDEVPVEELGSAPDDRAPATTLEVVSWRALDNSSIDGIEVVGTILNKGERIIMDVSLLTRIYDEEDHLLGTTGAFLGSQSLAPKASTSFRALFPKIYQVDKEPAFELAGTPIELEDLTD